MNAEREIAGFALPFTAGILFSISGIWPASGFWAISSLVITCTFLIYPAFPNHNRVHIPITWAFIALTAFFCGVNTGVTHQIISAGADAPPRGLTYVLLDAGKRMSEAINRIPFQHKDTNAIINALLTGYRADIPTDISDTFRQSGAAHILALSGLHLGIIYGIVNKLLSIAGNSPIARKTRMVLVLTICGAYTLATGAGPSITRAFIFIAVAETAKMTGRHKSTKSLFFSALTIQLVLSPLSVRSVSFQLSYAAMAGIAFIFPHIRNLWPESEDGSSGVLKRIWESASLSIACQMTTGPLAWIYFQSIPHYFILTNLIALPLSGLIIPFAIVTLILDLIGICPYIMTRATECLVETLTAALEIISSI